MEQKNTHILFEFDYLNDIKVRLHNKKSILNVSTIHKESGVPRRIIDHFISGEIPNISFKNTVKLYKYLEQHNI